MAESDAGPFQTSWYRRAELNWSNLIWLNRDLVSKGPATAMPNLIRIKHWQLGFKSPCTAKTKWIVVVVVRFRFKVSKVCHTAIAHSLRASSQGRPTTTTRKCLISRFMEDVNKWRRQFLSLSKLECRPQEYQLQGNLRKNAIKFVKR